MKKDFIILGFLIFSFFFQSCVPLNNVHVIDNYEIKEGKFKARKDKKRYTRYIVSNHSSSTIAIKYLDTKFKTFHHKNFIYVSHKIFMDVDINFNLEFEFTSETEQYLSLINLFMRNKRDSNDSYYNEGDDDHVQEGDDLNFISIRVKDDAGIDYLAQNSKLRGRLILYLNSLIKDYNFYYKYINFLDERETK